MGNDIKDFVRNHFEDGMLLTAADLMNLQDYVDGKRRLGYCGLIGYGVVCGLTAKASGNCLAVESGFAVDCQGREIYLPAASTISLSSLFLGEPESGEWLLCLEYTEEPCGEAFVISDKNLRETVHNRIREKYKFIAKRSRDSGDICISVFVLEAHNGINQISYVKSPVDAFHFAPLWEHSFPKYSNGSIYIDKDEPLGEDGVFRTGEICHGLGPGRDVGVELSIKAYDVWRPCEIYGDAQLFGVPVRAAAKLFPDKGTFVVAVKPEGVMTSPLCIRWHARTLQEDNSYV